MNSFWKGIIIGSQVLLILGLFFGGLIEYVIGDNQPVNCETHKYYNEGTGKYTFDQIQKMYCDCLENGIIKKRVGIYLMITSFFLCVFYGVLYCSYRLYNRFKESQQIDQTIKNIINDTTSFGVVPSYRIYQ